MHSVTDACCRYESLLYGPQLPKQADAQIAARHWPCWFGTNDSRTPKLFAHYYRCVHAESWRRVAVDTIRSIQGLRGDAHCVRTWIPATLSVADCCGHRSMPSTLDGSRQGTSTVLTSISHANARRKSGHQLVVCTVTRQSYAHARSGNHCATMIHRSPQADRNEPSLHLLIKWRGMEAGCCSRSDSPTAPTSMHVGQPACPITSINLRTCSCGPAEHLSALLNRYSFAAPHLGDSQRNYLASQFSSPILHSDLHCCLWLVTHAFPSIRCYYSIRLQHQQSSRTLAHAQLPGRRTACRAGAQPWTLRRCRCLCLDIDPRTDPRFCMWLLLFSQHAGAQGLAAQQERTAAPSGTGGEEACKRQGPREHCTGTARSQAPPCQHRFTVRFARPGQWYHLALPQIASGTSPAILTAH